MKSMRLEKLRDLKADKDYVDKLDRAHHYRIDEVKKDSADTLERIEKNISSRFEDIKSLIEQINK